LRKQVPLWFQKHLGKHLSMNLNRLYAQIIL
jgi:hypothetical protein